MSTLDFKRPVQTLDGRSVEIYRTDGGGEYPVHGEIFRPQDNVWMMSCWTADGKSCTGHTEDHSDDLVQISEKVRVHGYMNIYANGKTGSIRPTLAEALEQQVPGVFGSVKTVKIEHMAEVVS